MHTCHYPDCNEPVDPAKWGCKIHWDMVPTSLKKRLQDAYVPGQELTKKCSREYLRAAYAIRLHIQNIKTMPSKTNAKISLNWFVWSDEDGFEYFQTEAEALCVAREKIPTFCIDNYWEEGVDEIKVGCMTQEVGIVDRIETIDGYTCNYQLKPFENH
jgi:hypothetical protein